MYRALRNPLASLAAFLNRLGHHEPAATVAGFGFSPLNTAAFAEISPVIAQLRKVLGDHIYRIARRRGRNNDDCRDGGLRMWRSQNRRPGLSLFQRELAQIGIAVAEQLGTAG